MIEHKWQYILEASRQFLDALRLNAGSVQPFVASQSSAEALYAANVGRAIGHPASNARVGMSRDPRSDGLRRDDADVAGMFHALYANRPNVRLAALRLWRFYCRESITRLLAPHADSTARQDAIADLVSLGVADLAELDTAINQLALATGNLALAQVQAAAIPPVELSTRGFEVKAGRIADELARLADLLELIANGEADDIRDGDGWQTRTDAGLLVARLQSLLNYGDLDFADCDFSTLESLKGLWSSIKRLDFGDHSDRPKEYRGALFLPHELGPFQIGPNEFIPNQVLRKADEPYDAHEDFAKHLDDYEAVKKVMAEQFPNARKTTTKREAWGWYPDQLRSYAKSLARRAEPQVAAAFTDSESKPAAKPLGEATVLPPVNHGGELHTLNGELSTALSVLKRPQASENKLFPNGPPADDMAEKCILHLVSRRNGENPDWDILLDFFGGDEKRAKAMQAEIRRLRSDGVTTLTCPLQKSPRLERESRQWAQVEGEHSDGTRNEIQAGRDHCQAARGRGRTGSWEEGPRSL